MQSLHAIQPFLLLLAIFGFLTLGAKQVGQLLSRYRLPLISGYLIAGVIVGPFVFNLVTAKEVAQLRFIDDISLAVIAFSGGNELFLKDVRGRLAGIMLISLGRAIGIGVAVFYSLLFLADRIPFMQLLPVNERLAAAVVALAIIASLSPSSTIALISELRAKGPMTKTAVGVTVVTEVLVIVGFAVSVSIADLLRENTGLNLDTLLLLAEELAASLFLGYLSGRLLGLILRLRLFGWLKIGLILALGYSIFAFVEVERVWSGIYLQHELHLESLLICLVASFWVTNFTVYRIELMHLLEEASPYVFLAFFTLTGASLALDTLTAVWLIAVIMVVVRLVGLTAGSFLGGLLAREPLRRNSVSWMIYITQAGVGLGLAKNLESLYPEWGVELASLLIGVIVLNQFIGPPLFKLAMERLGETHTKAKPDTFDGTHDVMIMGIEDQSLARAQNLANDNWHVKLVGMEESERIDALEEEVAYVHTIDVLTPRALRRLGLNKIDVLLCMFNDDELNHRTCEIAFEHFGTPQMIVRLNTFAPENIQRFKDLGVRIINPQTAMLNLLNQFVRSPATTSLLLGEEADQQIEDIIISNREVAGVPLRDLRLPTDVLILSIRRSGHLLVTHGYSHLEQNDIVSVMGSPEGLAKVRALLY
ncbi:MAG: cation:proton antiporter [Anaerolineales bacterium]|nr:cation:proton antiporter [Anaerolineales bacterium]